MADEIAELWSRYARAKTEARKMADKLKLAEEFGNHAAAAVFRAQLTIRLLETKRLFEEIEERDKLIIEIVEAPELDVHPESYRAERWAAAVHTGLYIGASALALSWELKKLGMFHG